VITRGKFRFEMSLGEYSDAICFFATTKSGLTMTRLSRVLCTCCLMLAFGCVSFLQVLAGSPEVNDAAAFLAAFHQFPRLAESELSSQMKRADMIALIEDIEDIEDAVVEVAYTDEKLLTAHAGGDRVGVAA
jgi:hypothetical protein